MFIHRDLGVARQKALCGLDSSQFDEDVEIGEHVAPIATTL